jgi:ectoine hydroxylase
VKLTDEQIEHYDTNGYVVLEGLFSLEEVQLLQSEAEMLKTEDRGHADANTYESNGRIRAAWAMELDSPAFDAASRDPRIVEPVAQLLGEEIYLFQSRLNYKVALEGDVFQWHQDYGSWWQDGVPDGHHRKMLTVLVTLDDTTTENGPLRFIPGSHKVGLIEPEYDEKTTSYALHVVPEAKVDELAAKAGIFHNTGPAGSVAIFAGNLVHGSTANRSAYGRRNAYFAYNRWDNQPTAKESRRKLANKHIANYSPSRLQPHEIPLLMQLAADAATGPA